ncbi:feruloyl esterase [Variovorax sp. OK605]|uniref:tannase/feruloyl esterase family alpha/beta hydrolase n=1 Tax=Variovorax sp. OK605 TaxID=1855317 RepID=UPI0008F31DEC|nr:tannase/feruloyl esterase family alpha/beta hydrolase [Variovorax sp. OK605]SFP61803.1 feruloyl esterase [Variovorax sp. OK605]
MHLSWRPVALAALVVAAGLAAGCGSVDRGEPVPRGRAGTPLACAGLASAVPAGTRLTLSESVPAGEIQLTGVQPGAPGSKAPVPAHCHVQGKIDERTGIDGKPYAIGFDLRMPTAWNGRFFFQGGGGTDGTLRDAVGQLTGGGNTGNALLQGYAVVFTDTGHLDEPGADGPYRFGLDPQARLDNGYNSMAQTGRVAKALIAAHYAKAPERSYFVGCSNGGRQAMMMAQRYPDMFDGVIASAPAYRVPLASVQAVYDTQLYAKAAAENAPLVGGRPVLSAAFSPADMKLLTTEVLNQCDALDGLKDGIVDNWPACRFRPEALRCTGAKTAKTAKTAKMAQTAQTAKTAQCLTGTQVDALAKSFAGPKDANGRAIYSDWPFDAGLHSAEWTRWKFGDAPGAAPNARNITLMTGALAMVFSTPPTVTADFYGHALGYDVARDSAKVSAVDAAFPQSAMQWEVPDSPDVDAFARHGGKMLFFHGVSDPVFSVKDTVRYLGLLRERYGERTDAVARLFTVPNMAHCSGGPATDQYDGLSALVNWVEKGQPPERIVARARPENRDVTTPGRTRPLCAWPKQPRYKGSGSIDDAASFGCN